MTRPSRSKAKTLTPLVPNSIVMMHCMLTLLITQMIFSELAGFIARKLSERRREMLGRVESRVQRNVGDTDLRLLQQLDRFRDADIDEIVDGRKAGIAFYPFVEQR